MLGIRIIFIVLFVNSWISMVACCPSECRCDEKRNIVFCNERQLTRIPAGIPNNTKYLLLQGNLLTNSLALESILSRLTQLEKLDLHDNRLTSFPGNLPSSLTYLSLRQNRIKFIGKSVLKRLTNLQKLYLDQNNLTNAGVHQFAFSSATALKDLVMSSNQLTALPENLSSSLENLRVDLNSIKSITPRSLSHLNNLLIFDLSHNQIENSDIEFHHLRRLNSLNLGHNVLREVPYYLPENLTELQLAFNQIQFIYKHADGNHGDFQNLRRLKKLDVSSNQVVSVEFGAFDSLPIFLSLELLHNPWKCDCNLVYLKQWLRLANSTPVRSQSIACDSPTRFQGVTLQAIDTEALVCSNNHFDFHFSEVKSTNIIVSIDPRYTADPPYLSLSLMFGAMLCEDCNLPEDQSATSHSRARFWMEKYTIAPIQSPKVPQEITGFKPGTKYMICLFASNQHPDEVEIEQCRDVRTAHQPITSNPLTPSASALPSWLLILLVIAALVFLVFVISMSVICYKKMKKRKSSWKRENVSLPGGLFSRKGRPLVDANPEFDVTLIIPEDLKRQSCHSDSRDESFTTTHTGTTTSRTSGGELRRIDENIYEMPISPVSQDDNYDRLRLNDRNALFV